MSRNFKLLAGAGLSAFMLTACTASHAAPNTASPLDEANLDQAKSERNIRRFVIASQGTDINCEVIISTTSDADADGAKAEPKDSDTKNKAHEALSESLFFTQDGDVDCGTEGKLHITLPEGFNLNLDHAAFEGEFAEEIAALALSLQEMTHGLHESFEFETEFVGEDGMKQIVITTSDDLDDEALEREIERHVALMERNAAQIERNAEGLEKKVQRKIIIMQNRADNAKIRQRAYESELRSLEKARERINERMLEVEKRLKEAKQNETATSEDGEK